jgi:RimJ/RimL family protein N-acetyltransferase
MNVPILKGQRVTLRLLKLQDAPLFVRWFNDKEVVKYLLLQTGFTLREEQKYIRGLAKNKKHFNYAILTENNTHIGGSGTILFPQDRRAEVGIVIGAKDAWGNGYAVEVLQLVLAYIFKKLRYNRVELTVSMDNKRALQVYKKIGFKLEGIKRQSHWNLVTKKLEDEGIMSVLRKEWLKN